MWERVKPQEIASLIIIHDGLNEKLISHSCIIIAIQFDLYRIHYYSSRSKLQEMHIYSTPEALSVTQMDVSSSQLPADDSS